MRALDNPAHGIADFGIVAVPQVARRGIAARRTHCRDDGISRLDALRFFELPQMIPRCQQDELVGSIMMTRPMSRSSLNSKARSCRASG